MNKPILMACALACISFPAQAITLGVTDANIPSAVIGTVDSAGDYYNSVADSSSTIATLSIGSAPASPLASNTECGATDPAWKLNALLSTTVSGLTLRVRRTDNGSGGSLFGGESYITLSALPVTLFCGNGDVSDINLQFQLDALDVDDGYGTKTWHIDYSVETL